MREKSGGTNRLEPTAEDTLGPYYPHPFADGDRRDLTRLHPGLAVHPRGETIILRGRLLDSAGSAVGDAVVEFWQANADGVFRTPRGSDDARLDPYFEGYGRLITDEAPFEFKTIKPGATREDGGEAARAPNITVTIFSDGISRLVTQIFFEGEDANDTDPVLESLPADLRERLIARKTKGDGGQTTYEIDIIMRGERETPFFDDLTS